MTDDLQPERALSEWSPLLIGYEPCTGDYHASEWPGLERAFLDAKAAGKPVVLVRSDRGRFSLWAAANPFFSEMNDIEKARILRDLANRRITSREHALACFVADGLHLDQHGEWKSKKDLKAFQALCARPEVQDYLQPKTNP